MLTKEWFDGLAEAYLAVQDGRKAEYNATENRQGESAGVRGWVTINPSLFQDWCLPNLMRFDWRAKPEPKYLPLTLAEWFEAMQAGRRLVWSQGYMDKFPNRTFTNTNVVIQGVMNNGKIRVEDSSFGTNYFTPETLLERFVFADTKERCGALVNE